VYFCIMRKHNGMRPQDVAILLKIVLKQDEQWLNKDLSEELFISPAEISESLHRSAMAGLINSSKKKVHRQTLLEFIEYGLHVVFPVIPGGLVNGVFTAHSHPFMQKHFKSDFHYVWPDVKGNERGLLIEPLYKDVVKAIRLNAQFYKVMALLDVVRVGKARELKVAIEEIDKILNKHEPSY